MVCAVPVRACAQELLCSVRLFCSHLSVGAVLNVDSFDV